LLNPYFFEQAIFSIGHGNWLVVLFWLFIIGTRLLFFEKRALGMVTHCSGNSRMARSTSDRQIDPFDNFLGIGFSMATGAGGTAIQQKASAGIDLLESDWMAFRRDWYRVFTRSHAIGTSVRLCRYGL
jgi:hypothetical protein